MNTCKIPIIHLAFDHKIHSLSVTFNGGGGREGESSIDRAKNDLLLFLVHLNLKFTHFTNSGENRYYGCWVIGRSENLALK
jgi:hypothetical protein